MARPAALIRDGELHPETTREILEGGGRIEVVEMIDRNQLTTHCDELRLLHGVLIEIDVAIEGKLMREKMIEPVEIGRLDEILHSCAASCPPSLTRLS